MLADGKLIAENIKQEIKEKVKKEDKKSLAIFYVGKNKVIDSYVNLKKKFGEDVGILVKVFNVDENITEEDLVKFITKELPNFSSAIVQLPLPKHINKKNILDLIPVEKDVDVLAEKSFNLFSQGKNNKIPPVVSAILEIAKYYKIDFFNKNNLIVGQGLLVGRPMSHWFDLNNIKYQIIDLETKNGKDLISLADVIISGAGEPEFISADMIKKGVILFDAGTSTHSGKISGDFKKDCYLKSSFATPVPGGVGPVTVACLFKNIFL